MKTGINFVRCNCSSAEAHNERDKEYMEALERSGKKTYDIFHDRTKTNLSWKNPDYAGRTLEQILEDCRNRYIELVGQNPQEKDRVRKVKNKKTGMYEEKVTAGWSPIREGVCPVKEDTTISDFQPVVDYLEEKGLHVISIWIHRDEGYVDPVTGSRKYNLHGHVIVDWTDHATGRTAKLGKADMSYINQVILPNALGMEPGVSKVITGIDHLMSAQFREKAAAEKAVELEAKVAELVGQIHTYANVHRAEIVLICENYKEIGREVVSNFDWLGKLDVEQLKLKPKEQEFRDRLDEECSRDISQMPAHELMEHQRTLSVLIMNTVAVVKRLIKKLVKISAGLKLWPRSRIRHEAELQAKVSSANAERDQSNVVTRVTVKAAERAREEAIEAQKQHRKALQTIEADKATAWEEGRKSGEDAINQKWNKWYNNVGEPAINERDQLLKEKAQYQQKIKEIAKILTSFDPGTVKKFESAGIREKVGKEIWEAAKKPGVKASVGPKIKMG